MAKQTRQKSSSQSGQAVSRSKLKKSLQGMKQTCTGCGEWVHATRLLKRCGCGSRLSSPTPWRRVASGRTGLKAATNLRPKQQQKPWQEAEDGTSANTGPSAAVPRRQPPSVETETAKSEEPRLTTTQAKQEQQSPARSPTSGANAADADEEGVDYSEAEPGRESSPHRSPSATSSRNWRPRSPPTKEQHSQEERPQELDDASEDKSDWGDWQECLAQLEQPPRRRPSQATHQKRTPGRATAPRLPQGRARVLRMPPWRAAAASTAAGAAGREPDYRQQQDCSQKQDHHSPRRKQPRSWSRSRSQHGCDRGRGQRKQRRSRSHSRRGCTRGRGKDKRRHRSHSHRGCTREGQPATPGALPPQSSAATAQELLAKLYQEATTPD